MFSQLAHLLAPWRRKIGRQLLAALQCIRAWIGLGMTTLSEIAESDDQKERVGELVVDSCSY
jgi:hypothetical protein